MKKFALVLALVSVIFASAILAEESATPSIQADNVISVNTYPYLAAFFNLGYERKIIDKLSARVRGMYWGLSQGGWSVYGFGADVFFYPQSMACKGWYLGPRFDDWMMTYSKDGQSATGALLFLGGQAGYRWIFDGGFAMALSLGAMKNISATVTANSQSFDVKPPFENIILPTFDFELGYAF